MNGDGRFMSRFPSDISEEIAAVINRHLAAHGVLDERHVRGVDISVIRSTMSAPEQQMHYDYPERSFLLDEHTMPHAVLWAINDDFYLRASGLEGKVRVAAGDMIVFKANWAHAGSEGAGQSERYRIHAFVEHKKHRFSHFYTYEHVYDDS